MLNCMYPTGRPIWSLREQCEGLHRICNPRARSYLSSRLLGYVTIGYIDASSHYLHLGNWSLRVSNGMCLSKGSLNFTV